MIVSSFDIFDSCLVRKCGAPENVFDILSFRAFNGEVEESVRQEFVATRRLTEQNLGKENPYYSLQDIWHNFNWVNSFLKSEKELCELEQDLEREMLVPVLSVRDKINECRKNGDKIIFISDMYLSSRFLVDLLRDYGFYQDGDSLYVSCDCGALKKNGELFEYVRKKENLPSFRHWHHYGDNMIGDYKEPLKLGIKCTLINHPYTPYQQQWSDNDYSLGVKYPSILAGIGRAIYHSTEWNTHTDFVLDIIAPFYCSLVYRMMKDAEKRGIKRLYFCARDAYMMHQVALRYHSLFPTIDCVFLYISRKALYNGNDAAKISYYKSIGLATKEDYVGIVDVRGTGKTLFYLNDYLKQKGYNQLRGYYYELFGLPTYIHESIYPEDYYTEWSDRYDYKSEYRTNPQILETYFSMNVEPKTVDYKLTNGVGQPIFESESINPKGNEDQIYIEDKEYWSQVHKQLQIQYADMFVQCGLYKYSDQIFEKASNTFFDFFNNPQMEYMGAMACVYGHKWDGQQVPYVKKDPWWRLVYTRGKDSLWKEGTYAYSGLWELTKLYRKIRYRRIN